MSPSGSKWNKVEGYPQLPEFTGQYEHALDLKGRLKLPSSFREQLSAEPRVMMAIRPNQCMGVYPVSEWVNLLGQLKTLPGTDQEALSVKRVLLSTAFSCDLDRQGRILIPTQLRELGGITRDVTVVGCQEVFEVWDRAYWKEYFAKGFLQYDQNAAKLAGKL